MAFLLDSGASNSLLNIPTYMMVTQIISVCNHEQHITSKTLNFAFQSEVPIKQYISVTSFASKKNKSRYFMITFVVAVIEIFFSERHSLRNTYKKLLSKISHEIQSFDNWSTQNCFFYQGDWKAFSLFSFF